MFCEYNLINLLDYSNNMLTLSHDELVELTDRTQPMAQIRWLKDRAWLYEVGRNGRPKVARDYFY